MVSKPHGHMEAKRAKLEFVCEFVCEFMVHRAACAAENIQNSLILVMLETYNP
jgi:hypothetical protein